MAEGWHSGKAIDKGARGEPAEIGAAIRQLLSEATPAQKVYGS